MAGPYQVFRYDEATENIVFPRTGCSSISGLPGIVFLRYQFIPLGLDDAERGSGDFRLAARQ